MRYDEAVKFIEDTPRFVDGGTKRNKSGNENLAMVMAQLGNPELRHPAIHIAGTNGKGSTVRMTMCILCNMGYSVGTFISPHLIKLNERISISSLCNDGKSIATKDITDEAFVCCFERVMKAVEQVVDCGGGYLSYFEMLFAIAAVYYENKSVDYVIYETGLGGRLDATNLITPVITAITSIGLDHTAYLGDTIEQIAAEKAGIIKESVPIVYNTGEKIADEVIEKRAEELNSKAINVAKTEYIINEFSDKTIDFSCVNSYYRYDNIILNSNTAAYQVDNAMTAIALCNCLKGQADIIPENVIKAAFKMFFWPGRMERLGDNLVVDGAHNQDAINRFVESVKLGYSDKNISLLFAVAADKDYKPMVEQIVKELRLNKVYVTAIANARAISAEYVAGCFEENIKKAGYSCDVIWNNDIRECFSKAYFDVKNTDGILFCVGSLYLVGSIKELAMEVI